MSRFNTPNTTSKTTNFAGGEAYKVSPEFELISILLTSFLKDDYYRSSKDTVKTLQKLVSEIKDKKFIAKAAIYARTEFGLRSVSHVVTAELFRDRGDGHAILAGEEWAKVFVEKVVKRPDDILEILSYYMKNVQSKTRAMQLRKGIRRALAKFDGYQLAKYRAEDKDLSLVDVVNLMRPKPNDQKITVPFDKYYETLNDKEKVKYAEETPESVQISLYEALVRGLLKSTTTRQAVMSKVGQEVKDEEAKVEAKKVAWSEMLNSGKYPYFDLLKNLRNIINQAPESLDKAVEILTNDYLIKKSLVLPFRYMSAIQEIEKITTADPADIRKVMMGLNKAIDSACSNVPTFDGRTLVVVDHSGSMDTISHGNMSNFQIGALFGIMLTKSNNADFMHFGDNAEYLNFNPADSTLSLLKYLTGLNQGSYWGSLTPSQHNVGHGTNFHAIFETMNKKYDRVIIFSDMQAWVSYYTPKEVVSKYRKQYDANPHIYTIDLTGHGTAQFPESQVYALVGFSEKIFDTMKFLETDRKALMAEINKIEL